MTKQFLVVAWLALLASCTQSTSLQVLQPAEMRIPQQIQRITTIDRSQPSKGVLNVIEGLVTGEGIGEDRLGREVAVDGLRDVLSRTPRFSVIVTDVVMEGSEAGGQMAPPLPWEEVQRLCDQYQSDALLAIERYDTDKIVFTDRFEEEYEEDGKKRTRTRYRARADMSVVIGWRLYAPERELILDEFSVRVNDSFAAEGNTKEQARRNLPDLSAIARDISFQAGQKYGMRIAPVWVTVSRSFYTKGKGIYKEDMKKAARYAQTGQWERAETMWEKLDAFGDPKTAGRAAHNLAVARERLGDLEGALRWAEKAYGDHGHNPSRSYILLLRQRIEDAKRVQDQMRSDA
jgi:tetratricopeptide (TPR) repeat protein